MRTLASAFRRHRLVSIALATLSIVSGWSLATKGPTPSLAEEPSASKSHVGEQVADFKLADFRGAEHKLSDYADRKLVVLAFLGAECPLAKLYGPRLAELNSKFAGQGVLVLGINSNSQDSMAEIASYARVHNIKFPLLKDVGNKLADAVHAERTPEVFVLDADRVVRYWGRIDNQYGIGTARSEPTEHDLARAIEELLAGKEVSTAEIPSTGCHIGRIQAPKSDSKITYAKDIAPIFQARCVECHREGEIAPFALTDYEEIAGWAPMIEEVVKENRMPPWHANPKHGHFVNDRRLSDRERKLIADWVAAGAPAGDLSQVPPPKTFVKGWRLPQQPDEIIAMSDKPYKVPATGEVRYQYFSVDPGFKEDKYIRAAEIIPGNRAVVHHVLVLVRPPSGSDDSGVGDFLAGYVPGVTVLPFADDMAKVIPAGSKLIFQVHYTPNGSAAEDISRLGLVYADKDSIRYRVLTQKAATNNFVIPPRAANYKTEATSPKAPIDVQLLGMMPHMHLRGKSFRYEAIYPDGKKETLLDVPHYDFNWQTGYALAKPLTLPAGTRIHCEASFDNSADNLANPDPTATVRWGDQTYEEMMIGYFDIATPVDRGSDRAVAGRFANLPSAESIIKRFDKDGDGKLTKGESPPKLAPFFDLVDADKNEKIDEAELSAGLARLRN